MKPRLTLMTAGLVVAFAGASVAQDVPPPPSPDGAPPLAAPLEQSGTPPAPDGMAPPPAAPDGAPPPPAPGMAEDGAPPPRPGIRGPDPHDAGPQGDGPQGEGPRGPRPMGGPMPAPGKGFDFQLSLRVTCMDEAMATCVEAVRPVIDMLAIGAPQPPAPGTPPAGAPDLGAPDPAAPPAGDVPPPPPAD